MTSAFPAACMARPRVTMPPGNRMSYARKSPSLRPATQSGAVAADRTWWVRFFKIVLNQQDLGGFVWSSFFPGSPQDPGPRESHTLRPIATPAPLPENGSDMPLYLGLTYFAWALIAWGGIVSTFLAVLIYRLLISHRPEHEAFMSPAELRRTLDHIRNVNRVVIALGVATAAARRRAPRWGYCEYLMLKLVVLHAT